eukprot:6173237-Pleurochrysis_carterae.AAC.1
MSCSWSRFAVVLVLILAALLIRSGSLRAPQKPLVAFTAACCHTLTRRDRIPDRLFRRFLRRPRPAYGADEKVRSGR